MKTIYYDLEITFLTMQENLTFTELKDFHIGEIYLHLSGKDGEKYMIPLDIIELIETKIRFEEETSNGV